MRTSQKSIRRVPHPAESKAKKSIGSTFNPDIIDRSILDTFPYEYSGRTVHIEHSTNEFSCLCPFNEMPDHAQLFVRYLPDKVCIELKSLKYYLYSFRQIKIYHEHVVNKILEDLVEVLHPIEITVELRFAVRGGITTNVTASYSKK